ncbi:hypothetical protein JW930_03995 [Candidatus Woesearchaeota archaeon]|nr:hypothetical protein [Candidatus Woesearchaeota archaeon]
MVSYTPSGYNADSFLGIHNVDVESRPSYNGPIAYRFFQRGQAYNKKEEEVVRQLRHLLTQTKRRGFLSQFIEARYLLGIWPFNHAKSWPLELCVEFGMSFYLDRLYKPQAGFRELHHYAPTEAELLNWGLSCDDVDTLRKTKPTLAAVMVPAFFSIVYSTGWFTNPPKLYLRKRQGKFAPGSWNFPGGHFDDITEPTAWLEFIEETGWEDIGFIYKIQPLAAVDQFLITTDGELERYLCFAFLMKGGNIPKNSRTTLTYTAGFPTHLPGDQQREWTGYPLNELKDLCLSPMASVILKILEQSPELLTLTSEEFFS